MALSKKKEKAWDVNEEIKRVEENHVKLEKQIERITDKLCLERDQASEKRYESRLKNESMKKEITDAREELQNAMEKLRKLKDLADEEINSLIAERDDFNAGKLAFELEYEDNKAKLRNVQEQLSDIQNEYKLLAEHRDKITDQLVIERDNASDERYRARVRCEEIKTKVSEIKGMVSETRNQYEKLKEDSHAVTTQKGRKVS